jgi:hypothetical protein
MKRVYSLFGREYGDKKWIRLSKMALHKETAVNFYQNMLLHGSLELGKEMTLRPVAGWDSETDYSTIQDNFFGF